MKHNDATWRQIEAANPHQSTWLSANAGSGKTRVLTNRVARLLLGGVPTQNILCLTYTKAAATEMQNRLFKQLGTWAMKTDLDLMESLAILGAELPKDAAELARARTLFASALETPGGLRIQTIHSFCSALLRRFPLEAGVSPMFKEMDDRVTNRLLDETVTELIEGPDHNSLLPISVYISDPDFIKLAKDVQRNARGFVSNASDADIWKAYGLPIGYSPKDLLDQVFLGSESALLSRLVPAMAASDKSTDRGNAVKLAALDLDNPAISDFESLVSLFLTSSKAKTPFSAKTGKFPTKDVRDQHPEILSDLEAFMARVELGRVQYFAYLAAQKTAALHQFAGVFLPLYARKKNAGGWMDFDDLIKRGRDLLADPSLAQWVLFRLDGGLDHILVDEAQDTNPDQWDIIQLLAQEFTAGEGARTDTERTIFVVGDLKQSIYSFQGADPSGFERMRHHFDQDLGEVNQTLHHRSLEYSFRSSAAILDFVDAVFSGPESPGLGGAPTHGAFHDQMPGRVDLWPVVEKTDDPEEKQWYDPTDKPGQNDHNVTLARAIAGQIKDMCESGSIPDEKGDFRQIDYGDFLILVQRRSSLFHHIIGACKALRLPIAGADRLKVAEELAVKDLCALLSFLALPDDDLSLAEALRSPLLGISESELFEIAQPRGNLSLWKALQNAGEDFQNTCDILRDLLNRTDFLNPFELLERILARHDGRDRLVARLGPEAEVGIDAILTLALDYERSQTPSLTGFICWLDTDEVEIKRQTDAAGGRIRVMTTHGAKGLESPIVILPDTGDRVGGHDNSVITADSGLALWRVAADQRPDIVSQAVEIAADIRNQEMQRLLYVALTRAEKWLLVCGSGNIKPDGSSWYRQVEEGLQSMDAQKIETPVGAGMRHQHGDWVTVSGDSKSEIPAEIPHLPDWATAPAPRAETKLRTISPSKLGGDHSLPSREDEGNQDAALSKGRQVHLLLEKLPNIPQRSWESAARFILETGNAAPPDTDFDMILADVFDILTDINLAHVFSETSLAEVDIFADLAAFGLEPMRGTIDRLVVEDHRILIVDFKSNQMVPSDVQEIPSGILRQMGAYLVGIEEIYSDRDIELAVLWTATRQLMPVPHDIVRKALQSMPHLDVSALQS